MCGRHEPSLVCQARVNGWLKTSDKVAQCPTFHRKPMPRPPKPRSESRKAELISLSGLQAAGVTPSTVSRRTKAGRLERVGRGLYREPDAPVSEHHDLKTAVMQAGGKAVVVLVSALRFHELGTQVPHEVWLQIPAKARAPTIAWPPVRLVRSRLADAFTSGVQVHHLEGIPVPVTTPARTVADCFKHRSQIGLEACLEALRDLLARDRNVMPELTRHARMNRVLRLMQPYLEAMA